MEVIGLVFNYLTLVPLAIQQICALFPIPRNRLRGIQTKLNRHTERQYCISHWKTTLFRGFCVRKIPVYLQLESVQDLGFTSAPR